MSVEALESRPWSRQRWLGTIALIFWLQLCLIYALSDRTVPRVRPSTPPGPVLKLAAEKSGPEQELLALLDPTLFALPHEQGFAGAAWLKYPPPEMHPFQWSEQPHWLALELEQLGKVFPSFRDTKSFDPLEVAFRPGPDLVQPQPFLDETARAASRMRLEGELANMRVLQRPELPAWTNSEVLADTLLQMVLSRNGTPFSVTLLSGSGLTAADQYALERSRRLRFASTESVEAQSALDPGPQLSWGRIRFEWKTELAAPTNSLTSP